MRDSIPPECLSEPQSRTRAADADSAQRQYRRRAARALLVLLGLTAFFYAPVLLGLRTFPDGDFTHHFLPFSLFYQQEMLAGRLPLWNPYTYSGHPFLADVQAGVFYPLSTLLLAVTLPLSGAAARLYFLQIEAMLQIALGGWFTYLLVRRLTQRHDAGLMAGICFAFSGYLTGYPPVQLAILRTAIWLPLILWSMSHAVASPRRWGWWLATGIAGAVSLLAGHTQTFLYIGYASGAWLLVLLGSQARTLRGAGNVVVAVLGAGLALATFLGLSAAQLLPSVEFAQLSVRAAVDYAYVSGGFPLQDVWQLLLSGVLTAYSPLYIGVIGLGLAFIAVGAAVQREHWQPVVMAVERRTSLAPRGGVFFFLALALLALLLSFGDNAFLYPLFYRWAPGFDLFRGQERAAFLAAFGLSVLAGYGVLAVRLLPMTIRSWLATLYAGLVIGGVYLFGLLWQLPGQTAIGQGRFLLLAALAIGLAAGFALLLRLPGWSRERTVLLGLLVFANLFWANFQTNLDSFSPARKVLLAPEVEAVQAAAGSGAFSAQKRGEAEVRGEDSGGSVAGGRVYNEFRTYEDYAMRVGVEDVWGSSPLRLARYARLFDEFPLDRMWRLTGVTHVLTWRRELFTRSTLLAEFPQSTDATYLHRLAASNPRAWVAPEAIFAEDEEAARLLGDHTFDLERQAILPSQADLEGDLTQRRGDAEIRREKPSSLLAPASVQLTQLAPGRLALRVESETPGLLVVSENWMPGWRIVARQWPKNVGAPPLAPLRADLTLLGISIPAGVVAFDLIYQPDSVRVGLWIGAATLGVLAMGGAFAAWQARRRRDR